MDFAIRNLSVLAYAQGFTLWHYRAPTAPLARATAAGFFSPAADMLAAGDMMLVSASDGGRSTHSSSSSSSSSSFGAGARDRKSVG